VNENWLERILRQVQKPGRYTGGEWNAIRKDPAEAELKIALAFPDLYEVGMSYLGQKILYHILNSHPGVLAERVFAPWPDFEQTLIREGYPLFSLENRIPLSEFDILGFSLLYELNYSNILTMLKLGGIPLRSAERTSGHPLVAAGGPAAFNPEPVADVFDFFVIGDGEEAFPEIVDFWMLHKPDLGDREGFLNRLAALEGVYVPSRFSVFLPNGSTLQAVRQNDGRAAVVKKRVCRSIGEALFPADIIVPNIQVIHDRAVVEVERGCPQNCRFCQARQIYFPSRPRDPNFVRERIMSSLASTGYEAASLAGLSVGDYGHLEDVITTLMSELRESRVALSLPSLRPGGLTPEVVEQILRVRKTGFTLVPEAGTDRLRRVINKHLEDRDLFQAAETAFKNGWRKLKLYFMLGLPTETEEDVDGIADLAVGLVRLGQKLLGSPPQINLSVASFIPKPHTPFQWEGMAEEEVLRSRYGRLRSRLRRYRSIRFREHGLKGSVLEGVFSRGDRRLGGALQNAWEAGARFDSWTEHFEWPLWEKAFAGVDLDYRTYLGSLDHSAVLPWDHIHTGVKKTHLVKELEMALGAVPTPPCEPRMCRECGGCTFGFPGEEPSVPSSLPLKSGSRVSSLGEKSDKVLRYRVRYSKKGMARYFSHNDLVSQIQRGFRRAGIPVEYTQGFHPKIRMSFGPALALGMEGEEEVLEFRSPHTLPTEEFLFRINSKLPQGVRILSLENLEMDAPSLSEALTALVYSLDLHGGGLSEAVAALCDGPDCSGLSKREVLARRIQELGTESAPGGPAVESGPEVGIELDENRLRINIPLGPGRIPRPQDIVRRLLDLPFPAFHLIRERMVLLTGSDSSV